MIGLTESQMNGRIRILDRPLVLPGRCMICGASDRPVLDINFDIDDYGQVYFCLDCGREMLALVNAVDPDEQTAEIQSVRQENEQLIAEVDRLNGILIGVESSLLAFTSGGVRSANLQVAASNPEAESTITTDSESGNGDSGEDSEQGSGTSSDERSTSVSASSDDGTTIPAFEL